MPRSKKESMKKITNGQQDHLVGYIEKNKEIILKGKKSNAFDKIKIEKLWEQLAVELNDYPGPKRNCKEWKRVWTNMVNKRRLRSTEAPIMKKADLETKILNILSHETTEPNTMNSDKSNSTSSTLESASISSDENDS